MPTQVDRVRSWLRDSRPAEERRARVGRRAEVAQERARDGHSQRTLEMTAAEVELRRRRIRRN